MRSALLAGLLLALLPAPARADEGRQLFRLDDRRIDEASGMADLGDRTAIVNDSGDDPIVYVVDGRGRTVGTTRYADAMVDTEAMAPAGPGEVWVGDIGDNGGVRPSVAVYRVPIADGDHTLTAPRFDLTYPDGPHDAETLFVGPDGRLWIVTKFVAGGTAYVAPRDLRPDAPNRLRKVRRVPGWLTDGAIFPDGEHVLLRGYGKATLYDFPSFRPRVTFDLPKQPQGETLTIGPGERVRIGSEGHDSAVLQVPLPPPARRVLRGLPAEASTPSPSVTPTPADASQPTEFTGTVDDHPWIPAAFVVLVIAAIGWIPVTRSIRARRDR